MTEQQSKNVERLLKQASEKICEAECAAEEYGDRVLGAVLHRLYAEVSAVSIIDATEVLPNGDPMDATDRFEQE